MFSLRPQQAGVPEDLAQSPDPRIICNLRPFQRPDTKSPEELAYEQRSFGGGNELLWWPLYLFLKQVEVPLRVILLLQGQDSAYRVATVVTVIQGISWTPDGTPRIDCYIHADLLYALKLPPRLRGGHILALAQVTDQAPLRARDHPRASTPLKTIAQRFLQDVAEYGLPLPITQTSTATPPPP